MTLVWFRIISRFRPINLLTFRQSDRLSALKTVHISVLLLLSVPVMLATGDPAAHTAHASESSSQSLFNRGNYQMERQNYTEALSTFRKIEESGSVSGPLFFNMGISYMYLDSLGKASYYFQKSSEFRSTSQQAKEGIAFIEREKRARGTHIPYLPWYIFQDQLLFGLNHFQWIIRGLVFMNIGVLILLAGWRYRPDRRLVLGGGATAFLGVIILTVMIILHIIAQNYRQAVIIEPEVPIRPEPVLTEEPDTPDLAYEAYTVTLDRRISNSRPGWVHIRLHNGVTGWVPESSVRTL